MKTQTAGGKASFGAEAEAASNDFRNCAEAEDFYSGSMEGGY